MKRENNILFHILLKSIFTILLSTSIVYGSSFIPSNGQLINYTQVFFKWPQIPEADGYQLIVSLEENNQELLSIYSESNSFLLEQGLDWDTNYTWQVCGVSNYSSSCFEQSYFSVNALPEYHQANINILSLNEGSYQTGINILDFESLGYSLAIDRYGNIIWFTDKYNFWDSKIISAELLENGNFTGFSNGRGYEFTINSEIVFETPSNFNVHHQISKTPFNTYLILDAEVEYHPCPYECASEFSLLPIPWQGDRYIELNQLGEVIWEWNTFDHINLLEYNPFYALLYNGVNDFDWTHSNSILYDNISQSVYVSIRNLSRITSIDYLTGDINWNLGESMYMENPDFENEIGFSQQHSVQLTLDGNLIFFDNGRYQNPELSRCIEVGFDQQNEPYLIWEHILPDSMFTGSRGECDRLESGNSLITAGRTGNVLEVNNNNEIIWHLRALDNNGNNISIYRTQRVENIFPNIFSFVVNNITEEHPIYSIPYYGSIDISIFNQGWTNGKYIYKLIDENEQIILTDEVLSEANIINQNIDITDVQIMEGIHYTLEVCTINNLNNCQDINFQFIASSIGDVNDDGNINVFDVVIMVDYILSAGFNNNADLNLDGIVNVQDIILLVDIILQN